MKSNLYQCQGCTKLYEDWLDLYSIHYGDGQETVYYLCEDCIKSKNILTSSKGQKDLNTSEVKE